MAWKNFIFVVIFNNSHNLKYLPHPSLVLKEIFMDSLLILMHLEVRRDHIWFEIQMVQSYNSLALYSFSSLIHYISVKKWAVKYWHNREGAYTIVYV